MTSHFPGGEGKAKSIQCDMGGGVVEGLVMSHSDYTPRAGKTMPYLKGACAPSRPVRSVEDSVRTGEWQAHAHSPS